jgi:hypothetical protein
MVGIEPTDLDCLIADHYERAYATWKIPDPRDSAISSLLTKAIEYDQIGDLISVLSSRESDVLDAYAKRMAELAVRTRNVNELRNGIVAIGIASVISNDDREEMKLVSLLWHSAQILDLDAGAEFRAIAEAAPPTAEFLINWAVRPAKSQTIGGMHYQESQDEDGFRYKRMM